MHNAGCSQGSNEPSQKSSDAQASYVPDHLRYSPAAAGEGPAQPTNEPGKQAQPVYLVCSKNVSMLVRLGLRHVALGTNCLYATHLHLQCHMCI